MSIVGEFGKTNEIGAAVRLNQNVVSQVWYPLPDGTYKLNSDATCLTGGEYGQGGVMRDSVGDVIFIPTSTFQ